ncbi:MAG TPA: glycosyltransferase [Bacilli bacterium]|nr:glycosyltransferase [Bacilli bacterium]
MSKNLDICFLGGVFPKDQEESILANSIGIVQSAANNLQWMLIDGFDANLLTPVKIFTSVFIGSYPKRYKMRVIEQFAWNHKPGTNDVGLRFNNISIIKHFSIANNAKKSLKQWLKQPQDSNDKKKILFVYSLYLPFLIAARYAKKLSPDLTVCFMVPDLPKYMSVTISKRFIYTFFKAIEWCFSKQLLKHVDKFILLTNPMGEYLKISPTKYQVIEGMVDNSSVNNSTNKPSIPSKKYILYTGTLATNYGIIDLIDAMKFIPNDDFELCICGRGNSEPYIINAMKTDSRIKYLGLVQSKEIIELQRNAFALVNPRKNVGEYTKYSFPSKVLEYMISGNPVIAYKLDGIPKEYDKYLIYVPDDSTEALAKTIVDVLSLSDEQRRSIGHQSRNYVLHNKSNIIQTRKIIDFLESDHTI